MPASRASNLVAAKVPPAASPALAPARIAVARAYMPDSDSVLPYLRRIDEARWYSNYGPLLLGFEARLRKRFVDGAAIATVSSGTLALTITLQALTAGARDTIAEGYCILPSWTFVATAHAVAQAGLRPWFVDVDPHNGMLDPKAVLSLLKQAPGPVQAVIPVAAFGRMPDLDAWKQFEAETGLPVLLDAAAAFDALDDAPIPAMVSLHATKILGVGEGGFVVARDPALAAMIRKRANFGFQGDRTAREVATNAKLSEYAAALGHASLDHWPATRMRYMLSAQRLRIALIGAPEVQFQPGWGSDWISTTCIVGLPEGSADHVEAALAAQGVETRRWWGQGCHKAPAFAGAARTALPVTERLAKSTIGLPFALDLSEEAIGRVAEALIGAVRTYHGGSA